MKSYKAYTLHNASDDTTYVIWWDGHKLCASNDAILRKLKQHHVDGMDYSEGEKFFDSIPRIFRSGYLYAKKTKVDESGKPV